MGISGYINFRLIRKSFYRNRSPENLFFIKVVYLLFGPGIFFLSIVALISDYYQQKRKKYGN